MVSFQNKDLSINIDTENNEIEFQGLTDDGFLIADLFEKKYLNNEIVFGRTKNPKNKHFVRLEYKTSDYGQIIPLWKLHKAVQDCQVTAPNGFPIVWIAKQQKQTSFDDFHEKENRNQHNETSSENNSGFMGKNPFDKLNRYAH